MHPNRTKSCQIRIITRKILSRDGDGERERDPESTKPTKHTTSTLDLVFLVFRDGGRFHNFRIRYDRMALAGGTTDQASTKSDSLGAGQLWGRSAQCPVPGHEDVDG